jgi:hypothetical protein
MEYNEDQIQGFFSNTCEHYTVDFILMLTRGFSIKEIIECFNLKILILMILELVLFINNKKILIFDLNVDYFIFEIKSSKSKFVKSSR